jgi:hypothetical protein
MSTIVEKINKLVSNIKNTKTTLINAISEKGVEVPASTSLTRII